MTVDGTVATPAFDDLSVNVTPEGAAAESVSDRFWALPPEVSVNDVGKKFAEAATWTMVLADPKPLADAVMLASPKSIPLIAGGALGVVCPCEMNADPDTNCALLVSPLVSVKVTPPAGAGCARLTFKVVCDPGATLREAGSVIAPCTLTFAVASGMFGRLLACITAEPGLTAVMVTVVVLLPDANVAVGGTVATPVLLELRLTETPPAGAAAESVSVTFCVPAPFMVMVPGGNATAAPTCTRVVPDVYPVAEDVIVAPPMPAPVICG